MSRSLEPNDEANLSYVHNKLQLMQSSLFEIFPGDIEKSLRMVTETFDYLNRVSKIHPDDLSIQDVKGYTHKNYAMIMAQMNRRVESEKALKDAEEVFRSVIKEDSLDAGALNGLGNVESLRGNYDKALEFIDKALAIDPTYEAALSDRNQILSRLKKRVGEQKIIMIASLQDQQYLEDIKFDHSIFTHQLIEALSGDADSNNDGLVSAMDVFKYLSKTIQYTKDGKQRLSNIFLSYHKEDRKKAEILAEALEQHGYSVWWDRNILTGENFGKVIKEALDAAKCMIVLWSKNSVKSDWVQDEANEGMKRHILIPILIEDVGLPKEFARIQAANLIDWRGNFSDPEFSLLLNSISEFLKRPTIVKNETMRFGTTNSPLLYGDLKNDFTIAGNRDLFQEDNIQEEKENLNEKNLNRLIDLHTEGKISDVQYELAHRLMKSDLDELSEKDKVLLEVLKKVLNDLLSGKISISELKLELDKFIGNRKYRLELIAKHGHGKSEETSDLNDHQDWVNSLVVTYDGKCIISASTDNTIKIWDVETGKLLRSLMGHSTRVGYVELTPDSKYIISASRDHSIKIWDIRTGELLRTLLGHAGFVEVFTITPDGKYIISGSYDRTLKIWDIESGVLLQTLKGHSDYINSVVVSNDGKRAASISADQTLKIWDLENGFLLYTLANPNDYSNSFYIKTIALTPDGRFVISASNNQINVWDMETGELNKILEGHTNKVTALAVPDNKRIISASGDGTLKVWDIDNGIVLNTLSGGEWFSAVTVTSNGKYAIAVGFDNVRIWNLESGNPISYFYGNSLLVCCAVSPDGKTIIAGGEFGRMYILRVVEVD